jgi:hypothetical protein
VAPAILRAPNSVWFQKVDQTTVRLNGPGLVDISPLELTGKRAEPLKIDRDR